MEKPLKMCPYGSWQNGIILSGASVNLNEHSVARVGVNPCL
jgi:hypothetical protein